MSSEDRAFMKRFGAIVTGLMIFSLILIVFVVIYGGTPPSPNPAREEAKLERIKPLVDVYVDEAELPVPDGPTAASAQQPGTGGGESAAPSDGGDAGASSAAAAPAQAEGLAAAGIDGAQIYQQACAACHISGAAGAPRMQPSAWEDRLPKGIDTLVQHAINGYKLMPAKGGRTDLSDEQVRAAVAWMVAQVEQ